MQKLIDLQQGAIVKLDGIEFKVALTTPQGVKVKAKDRLFNAVFDSTRSSFYNPNSTTNLGYQLNEVWYNTLSKEAKSMIVNATWNTGIANNEDSRQITAKVGILTKSEWESLNIQTMGLLSNAIEWLITSYTENITLSGVYTIDTRYTYNVSSHETWQTFAVRPALVLDPNLKVGSDGTLIANVAPTITTTSPTANQTFHENSTLTIAGSTVDTDVDDVLTIKYQIDSGTVRNLHSAVSDGATPINFSKDLVFKSGNLYDGKEVVLENPNLDDAYNLSIWAEDDKGGVSEKKSIELRREVREISFELKDAVETSELAERIYIQFAGQFPEGTRKELYVCNNAFDATLAWENASGLIQSGIPHIFMNKEQVNVKAGIKFKIKCVKPESSTELMYIDYVSGGFD